MTTTDDLMRLTVAALAGKTIAGAAIYSPRDWPSIPEGYPMIKIATPMERKDSLGPNAPQYDCTTTIQVIGTLKLKPVTNDQAAGVAQAALGAFQRQIERAVINDYDLYREISEIVSVDVKNDVRSDGSAHLAELTMDLVMKFYQGTEDFAPIPTTDVKEIALFMDLLAPADLLGTYTPDPHFPYARPAAPRTQGPDGRVEIGALIELPTES